VTGAGFLARHLVDRLRAAGTAVRVVTWPPLPDQTATQPGVQTVAADVRSFPALRRALAGCGVVFHTAGVVAVWGPALAVMRAVHVDGTRNVIAAADADARIVHVSSVTTVGATYTGRVLTEDSPFQPTGLRVDYVQAKREAEALALAAAAGGRDVTVANPGYLVGPEDWGPSVMGRLCRRYWKGRLPVAPGSGCNFVDVRDSADGLLRVAERGRAGRRYILGGENRTVTDFFRLLADAAGMRPRAVPTLPWPVLWAAAMLGECRAWRTGKEPYPGVQVARLNRYCWFTDSTRAREELGFQARPLVETIADTYRWFADRRRLPQLEGLRRWWLRPGQRAA